MAAASARPASPMSPSTRYNSAPAAADSVMVTAGAPAGITIKLRSPARAAYAAHAAPAFPLLGMATPETPSSAARETPTAAPRALNVPVGIRLSSFISSCETPSERPSRGRASKGVIPSPRLTTLAALRTGSNSWYRHRSGGRSAICARLAATLLASYLASSGDPQEQVPCTWSAAWLAPQAAHSRWDRAEYELIGIGVHPPQRADRPAYPPDAGQHQVGRGRWIGALVRQQGFTGARAAGRRQGQGKVWHCNSRSLSEILLLCYVVNCCDSVCA